MASVASEIEQFLREETPAAYSASELLPALGRPGLDVRHLGVALAALAKQGRIVRVDRGRYAYHDPASPRISLGEVESAVVARGLTLVGHTSKGQRIAVDAAGTAYLVTIKVVTKPI